ncbi:MAG TPA: AMP-binding protein [Candidatus Binatia bacterium]|nr:AMP-binding protein [Candidatus Binatia bacterium]
MTATLPALLDAAVARGGSREALAWAPADAVAARLGWTELAAATRTAAKKLAGVGVGKGTRVGLLASNRLEWLPIAFGALRTGAVLVPLSTLWKRDEIAYALAHADVQVLVTLARFLRHDYAATLGEILPELAHARPGRLFAAAAPALRRVVVLEGAAPPGAERWDDLAADFPDDVLDALARAIAPADLATIFFTSGTTARAKAVVHAHGALVASARRIADAVGIGPEDAWWGHMPLFWSGGFVLGALATIAGGGRIVLQEVVEAGAALRLLEAEGCTVMAGWHQAAPLLEHPDFATRQLRLRKGSWHPLAPRLLGPDHRAVGMYGMSETATCVACARFDDPEDVRTRTFGRPLPGTTVRIVDPESGRDLAPGETGEILVRGPTLMEGYYRVPREQTLDAAGFFHTGDLGRLDAAGCLHFATRLKDVVKTAGVNVAAAEVEEALARHAAVAAAHVVGVPHPTRGENLAAFVVLRPGAAATAQALRDFCRATLASYKVPRHVFLVGDEDVPRTASGRVEKTALRAEAERRVRRGG